MNMDAPEWDFPDKPADSLSDDDPEVVAGMAHAAEAKAAAEGVPEYRFGGPLQS